MTQAPVETPVAVGTPDGGITPTATPTPVKAKQAAKSDGAGSKVEQLLVLVLVGAVLLGAGGVTGLYLTRHR